MKSIAQFSIRSQQAIGAALVEKFCRDHGISNASVSAFVAHHWNLAIAADVPAWDIAGTELEVSGRGDLLPSSLVEQLGGEISNRLARICQFVAEIALSQLYGAYRPAESYRFLNLAADEAGVCLTNFEASDAFQEYEMASEGWGPVISQEELYRWQADGRRLCHSQQ